MRLSSVLAALFLAWAAPARAAGDLSPQELPLEAVAPSPTVVAPPQLPLLVDPAASLTPAPETALGIAPQLTAERTAAAERSVLPQTSAVQQSPERSAPEAQSAEAEPAAAAVVFDQSKTYPVLIIGGGPAGLSLAERLKSRGVEAAILEKGEGPGQSWKSMPSRLKVLSEWKLVALPGTPAHLAPAEVRADRHALPSAKAFSRYLDDYAAHHGLSIVPGTTALGLERAEGGLLRVLTSRGAVLAKAVVNATGYFSKPFTPAFAGAETRPQDIHFAQYKDPGQIAERLGGTDKKVLVVGRGLSAGQVMRELAEAGFAVTLSARGKVKHLRENSERLEAAILPVVEPAVIALGLGHFIPPEVPMEGGKARELLESGRVPLRGNIARLEGRDVVFEDGSREAFDLIVYATGFRPALDHLSGLSLDEKTGRPAVEGMASAEVPGLYFLGLSGEPTFRSRFLRGIRADAEALAKVLAAPAKAAGRLRALVVSHVLGVFNDTALRTLFAVWVAAHLPKEGAATYVSLATALFVLPYLLFSTVAGRTADRFEKRKVVRVLKVAEALILAAAVAAFAAGSIHAVLAFVFLMGTHAAFLSPAKYGMLPEQVGVEELAQANGLLEFSSVVAILVGTAAGGLLAASLGTGVAVAAAVFAATSLVGIAAARRIPAPRLKPPPEAKGKLQLSKGIKLAMAGAGFFWLLGTILQMNVSLFAEHTLRASQTALTALLTTMGVGMGLGAFAAGRLSKGRLELGFVPLGALGAALAVLDLALFGGGSLARTFVDMALANFFGGLFLIPLDAYVQRMSAPGMRGRTLGVGNIASFASILASSGLFFLLSSALHLSPPAVFLAAAFISLAATAAVFSALGREFAAFLRRLTGRAGG